MTLQALGTEISRVKTGRLMIFGGWRLPAWDGYIEVLSGWIFCNGAVVPNSGRSAALATMLGTRFGGSFGQTPDFREGKVPIPKGGSFSTGQVIGEINHVLTMAEFPAHQHEYVDKEDPAIDYGPGGFRTNHANIDGYDPWNINGYGGNRVTYGVGGGGAHNNMPFYFVAGPMLVHL
jgi:microcystin-dependent protein